jgi:hypothetical protein
MENIMATIPKIQNGRHLEAVAKLHTYKSPNWYPVE